MRRDCLIVLILVSFLLVANSAQVRAQLFRYGFKAGVDVSDYKIRSGIHNLKNKTNFLIGGVFQFNLPLVGFGIESGLQYASRSYGRKELPNDVEIGQVSDLHYLTIPIVLKKSISFSGIIGMYFSAGVFGNIRVNGGELIVNDYIYDQKEFQTGVETGAGISFLNRLELGAQYRYKFTDAYSQDVVKFYRKIDRQTWTISLTYLF